MSSNSSLISLCLNYLFQCLGAFAREPFDQNPFFFNFFSLKLFIDLAQRFDLTFQFINPFKFLTNLMDLPFNPNQFVHDTIDGVLIGWSISS